ncbi:unnamed protein product [Penicillium bialowiezense]
MEVEVFFRTIGNPSQPWEIFALVKRHISLCNRRTRKGKLHFIGETERRREEGEEEREKLSHPDYLPMSLEDPDTVKRPSAVFFIFIQRIVKLTEMDNEIHDIVELPTIADIEASTDVVSIRTNAIKVVRVNDHFAVKIGYSILPLEAENMKFVAANSKVPVPKVHANFVEPETRKRYVVMDFVPGTDLQKLLPSLTPTEKATISKRIKEAIDKMRRLPSTDYIGNLDGTPYIDGVLSSPDNNPVISGPFKDQDQMNRGILERLGQTHSPHYIRLVKEMINRTLKNHRIVFTHGDLQSKNIIAERIGVCYDGVAHFKVTLIDWNLSGWYPEFWDFCNSTLYCHMKPDWLELAPDIFDQYPIEYLMMQVVYSSVSY